MVRLERPSHSRQTRFPCPGCSRPRLPDLPLLFLGSLDRGNRLRYIDSAPNPERRRLSRCIPGIPLPCGDRKTCGEGHRLGVDFGRILLAWGGRPFLEALGLVRHAWLEFDFHKFRQELVQRPLGLPHLREDVLGWRWTVLGIPIAVGPRSGYIQRGWRSEEVANSGQAGQSWIPGGEVGVVLQRRSGDQSIDSVKGTNRPASGPCHDGGRQRKDYGTGAFHGQVQPKLGRERKSQSTFLQFLGDLNPARLAERDSPHSLGEQIGPLRPHSTVAGHPSHEKRRIHQYQTHRITANPDASEHRSTLHALAQAR
jgi:hypothetical protein